MCQRCANCSFCNWKKILLRLLFLHIVKSQTTTNLTLYNVEFKRISGGTSSNTSELIDLCNSVENDFRINWYTGTRYLSTYLRTLQLLNCSKYKEECQERTFAFNRFTSLMYLRFCNFSSFEQSCAFEFEKFYRGPLTIPPSSNFLLYHNQTLNFSNINAFDFENSCFQVAGSSEKETQNYFEIINIYTPFCSVIWCGFDKQIIDQSNISIWTCMPNRCRKNIIIVTVICIILAVAITICNAMVLGVLFKTKKLINGQAVHRISLAFADMLVGVIVLPTFVNNMLQYYVGRLIPDDATNEISTLIGNTSSNYSSDIQYSRLQYQQAFSKPYINVIGFFTLTSLGVSLATLAAAAIDRFLAVHKAIRYRKSNTVLIAQRVAICIWLSIGIIALVPLWIEELGYSLDYPSLVIPQNTIGILLTLIFIYAMFIILWFITIATFLSYHAQRKKLKHLTSQHHKKQELKKENQLLVTLAIMIGIFTASVLPALIVIGQYLHFINQASDIEAEKFLGNFENVFASVEAVTVIILLTNSLWNFCIYSARDKAFRHATKNIFQKIFNQSISKQGSSSAS